MANEFDVLIKQLEILEKIVISRPINVDDKDKQTIINVIKKFQVIGVQLMGDKFENISNSTIVNRSLLANSLNKISSKYGNEVENALEQIASHIEQLGNGESAELLNGFSQEINNEKPNHTVLKTLWDGLVRSLPDVAKVSTAIATISKIFT